MIKEGIYTELSSEDYHADKESISRSALMDFKVSGYNYWSKHLNPDRPKKDATPQMFLGSAFHTLILEPHLFVDQYAIKPPRVLLKDVGREVYDDFKRKELELESTNKIVISQEDYLNLLAMERKLKSNLTALQLIHDARIENSFFWTDKDSGLLLKCRPDILHSNMIVDLKTSSDASPEGFQREMVKYGYHIQGAIIQDGIEKLEGRRLATVINICIETKYPYHIGIYIIDDLALDAGQETYKHLCKKLRLALKTNLFTDYGIRTISLPKWALND